MITSLHCKRVCYMYTLIVLESVLREHPRWYNDDNSQLYVHVNYVIVL